MSIEVRRIGAGDGGEMARLTRRVLAAEHKLELLAAKIDAMGVPPNPEQHKDTDDTVAPKKRKRGAENAEI